MQFAGAISSTAASMGGITSAKTRTGLTVRARRTRPRQPTPSQSIQRAIFAGLPGLWRKLPQPLKSAWVAAAPAGGSGYTLYCQLHRNLRTLDVSTNLLRPPQQPSFPPFTTLIFTPVYAGTPPALTLQGWQLTYSVPTPSPYTLVLRTTAAASATRTAWARGDYKITALIAPSPNGIWQFFQPWQSLFGTAPPIGTIGAAVSLMDPATGYESNRTHLRAYWNVTSTPPQPGSTLTIEVNGQFVATIPAEEIFVNGVEVI